MSPIKSILAAFIVGISGVSVAAPVASAEATTVVVINRTKIMRDSKAGQDVIAKVTAIETQMNAELKPKGDAYTSARDALLSKFEGQTRAQIEANVRADQTLLAEDKRVAELRNDAAIAQRIAAAELELTERKAWTDFYTALRPVLQEVVDESGADIMLYSSNVVYGGADVDVTDLTIEKLDAATPTIEVVRQKLPEQPAQ